MSSESSATKPDDVDEPILDVGTFCFGIPEIERYMHRYKKAVPETRERQRRLQRRWERSRAKLHRRTTWPRDQILEWQLERVSALVDFAYNTIPLYRDLYNRCGFRTGDIGSWDDYDALPTITKDDLRRDFPNAQVLAGVDPARCYGARTSGSTGVPLSTVRDDLSTDRWMMHRLRQFELMLGESLRPEDWIYNIYLSTWDFTSFDSSYPTFSVSEDCPAPAIFRHISKLRPRVISVFPSFLNRLTAHAGDLSQYGVGCICTNSESSSKQERLAFEEAFGVPVLDEYSTEELTMVATECRLGRYHVVEDRVRIDVANPDAEGLGDIVATDLSNFYMPIIRYFQGDLIQWSSETSACDCGNNFRYLGRFLGRADQALDSASVGRVPPDRVMNLCDRTLVLYASGIAEFRLIQQSISDLDLMLVLRPGESAADAEILGDFYQGLRELFQSEITIRASYLDALPQLPSYKRRMIINQIS